MVDNGKNYQDEVIITWATSAILNGEVLSGVGSMIIRARGFYFARLDGVDYQFAVVSLPKLYFRGVIFDGSFSVVYPWIRFDLVDDKIYDKGIYAFPLFKENKEGIAFYTSEAAFVSVFVDDKNQGIYPAKVTGQGVIPGVSFSRGRHKVELKVQVE